MKVRIENINERKVWRWLAGKGRVCDVATSFKFLLLDSSMCDRVQ